MDADSRFGNLTAWSGLVQGPLIIHNSPVGQVRTCIYGMHGLSQGAGRRRERRQYPRPEKGWLRVLSTATLPISYSVLNTQEQVGHRGICCLQRRGPGLYRGKAMPRFFITCLFGLVRKRSIGSVLVGEREAQSIIQSSIVFFRSSPEVGICYPSACE